MTGAPVPPARVPEPPEALLDGVSLVECISADDVEGVAAILRHCDLTATAAALDSLLAKELVSFSPMGEAFGVLQRLAQELKSDPSPGNAAITLARTLCTRWCDSCIASGDLRQWALAVTGHRHGQRDD